MNLPPSQQAILEILAESDPLTVKDLEYILIKYYPEGTLKSALRSLERKGLIEKEIQYTGKVGQSPRVYKLKELSK